MPRPAGSTREPARGSSVGRTVLVAEDEPMVRLIVASTLRELGFEVLEGGDGEAALAAAAIRRSRSS